MTNILKTAGQFPKFDNALQAFDDLALHVPQPLVEALEQYAKADDRLRTVNAGKLTTQRFTGSDLTKTDWQKRLIAAGAAKAGEQFHRSIAATALSELKKTVEQTFMQTREEFFLTLEAWYQENIHDLAAEGTQEMHPAEERELTKKREAFERAHRSLLGPIPQLADSAEWFIRFNWNPVTFQHLVNNTGPGYDPRNQNIYKLALDCGADLRLARNKTQILEDHRDSGPGSEHRIPEMSRSERQKLDLARGLWGAELVNR